MKNLYRLSPKMIWKSFISQDLAFISICIYLFFEYVRPQQVWPIIDILPYAQICIILATIAALTSKTTTWVSHFQNKLLTTLFIITILSSITAYFPAEAFDKINLLYMWVIVYFLIINIVRTEEQFFLFLIAFILFNLKMSQHGAISFAQRGFSFTSWGVGGAPGWFQNSGEFGIEMCIFFPISLYFYLALKPYVSALVSKLLITMPISALLSLIATSSRGAILGILSILAYIICTSKYKLKSLILLSSVIIAGYYLMPPEFLLRFETAGEDETSMSRMVYWKTGWDLALNHPFTGIGFKNWVPFISIYHPEFIFNNKVELAHNTYIEIASEIGLSGLLIYILMVLAIFITNYNTRNVAIKTKNNFHFMIAKSLDCALIGYLVSSTFISTFIYPFFWLLLAMSVALNNVCTKPLNKLTK